jgi:hypothetical protein
LKKGKEMPKEKKTDVVQETPIQDMTYDELYREAANLMLSTKNIMLRLALLHQEMQKRISDAVS